jgi:hypothetical protein
MLRLAGADDLCLCHIKGSVTLSILQDLFYSQSTHAFYKEELIEMTDTNQVIDSNLYYLVERFFFQGKHHGQFSYNITIL